MAEMGVNKAGKNCAAGKNTKKLGLPAYPTIEIMLR